MKRVITYGTFDLFHIGHLNLLKRAKELGDYLIVGVSTDEFNELKGKRAIIPYEQRAEIVKAIKYVDLVIPERSWEQKIEDIKKYNVDILVMGSDWEGKFDYLKKYVEVVYLPRTEGISSTILRGVLKSYDKTYITKLEQALKLLSSLDLDGIINALELLKILIRDFK